MKTQGWRMEDGCRVARSVLECGRPAPLFPPAHLRRPDASARALGHSKTWGLRLAICLLTSVVCLPVSAQYSLDWSTIAGGGGTSTGGVYSVSGTIGQPDAGQMSGGNFTLQSGFWSILAAAPTPVAPSLSITLNPQLTTITVSWPSPSTGWNLQQNTNGISSLNWSNLISGITDDGATKSLIINPPAGNRFYRLVYQP